MLGNIFNLPSTPERTPSFDEVLGPVLVDRLEEMIRAADRVAQPTDQGE